MAGQPLRRERKRLEEGRAKLLAEVGLTPLPLPTPRRAQPEPWSDALAEEAVLLGAEGLTEPEIAAHWNISLRTLGEWRSEHAGFAEALERAGAQNQAWWEEKLRRAIATGDNRFAAGAWLTAMRARFASYGEKVEHRHTIDLSKLVMIDLRTPSSAQMIEGEVVSS